MKLHQRPGQQRRKLSAEQPAAAAPPLAFMMCSFDTLWISVGWWLASEAAGS